ncbi:MAG: hypothetical protein IPO88_00580 [Nannocystis sp.]|uniref:hypothetical protein n=1 Tax=Nannocystis sp. TaxID=1962667 RepID=UPI0024291DD4|nr:hypothetical protein [Nannocystis sp.]MBK9751999.1 hypothetical protein [Nannocystis sp.]
MNHGRVSLVLAMVGGLASCYAPGGVDPLVDPPTSGSSGEESGETGEPQLREIEPIHGVDLLFVLDDTRDMALAQRLVAQAGTTLASEFAGIDLRIGFTTTDTGNPRCPVPTPEDGALVRTSCHDAPERFVFDNEDFWDTACGLCSLRDDELGWIPTTTAVDPNLVQRPWIERAADGAGNYDPGVDLAQAFACVAPLGVSGCGFETPLESLRRAMVRTTDPGDINYGFVRDDTILAIVLVSNETDCSARDLDIFTINQSFWDGDVVPTSAACWRAGVTCTGAGPAYARCDAADFDASAAPAASAEDAVLVPVADYIEFMRGIASERSARNPAQQVLMRLLSGVPDGYELGNLEIPYVAAPEESVNLYGIGPGCTASDGRAGVPPVREREVVEAFQVGPVRNIYSICADGYDDMFAGLAAEVRAYAGRVCVPQCVADRYASTPEREPDCVFTRADLHAADPLALIPMCGVDDLGGAKVPDGHEHCFVSHTDRSGATPEAGDDLTAGCREQGYNLEISLVARTPGDAPPRVRVDCSDSSEPTTDCPLLAGS